MRNATLRLNNTRGSSAQRFHILLAVVMIFFVIIVFRLFEIQVMKHDLYKALAQDQYEFFKKTVAKRGEIYVRDGASGGLYPLAVNKELNLVYSVPKSIDDKRAAAHRLAELLLMQEEDIYKIIDKKDDPYEVIAHKVQDDIAEKIKKEKIKGIGVIPETVRYYPENSLAANVLGFVGYRGNEKVGQYGIEGYYDDRLKGENGYLELEKDALGSWISIGAKSSKSPVDGDGIVLTINQAVQFMAEKSLQEAITKYEAASGNIIIMNPQTGAIIAMAQYPAFNPNEYNKEKDMGVFLNSGVHNTYEPGSIQKTITMATGIDLGKVAPTTKYVDEGQVKIGNWTIHNSVGGQNGEQTMVQVLEKSLNTGSVFVQQQVEKGDYFNYLKKFGLDSLTNIDVKGEAKGNLSNLDSKSDIGYATASFGQGISVTPLEMLVAVTSFANDGKLMRPYIAQEFIHSDGSVEKVEPQMVRQVVSARTANLISAMMVSVVENSHRKAIVKGYRFAGKTGTAQVPKKDSKGYEEDKTVHTFIGFGPLPNPKFSILVKLDYPKARFADSTTVPTFHDLAQELVNYYNIPPTEELK